MENNYNQILETARESVKIQKTYQNKLNYLISLANKGEIQKEIAQKLSIEFNIILN